MSAPTFTFHITNVNSWGKDAVTSTGYVFDDLYYKNADSVSRSFEASSGGFGFEAGISAGYNIEAGIKSDLTVHSGTMNADYAFSANATPATADQVIDIAPFVATEGLLDGLSQITTQGGGATDFDVILAALAQAYVTASIGVSFPDIGGASIDIPIVDMSGGAVLNVVQLAQDGIRAFNFLN